MKQIAMITGASGGLGRAVARLLEEKEWALVLVGRDREKLEGLGAAEVAIVEADVSTHQGARSAVKNCVESVGGPPAALVHCAGTAALHPLHLTSEAQYRDCLSANLDSSFFMLGAFVDALMRAKQPGAAVLVSSVAAATGIPRHEAIAAAKAGIEGLVRSAASSYAPRGIRVNAVAPGLMRTPATERFFTDSKMEKQLAAQYPLGRLGTVNDAAAAIAWLVSAESSWITGHTISVDGGFGGLRSMMRS